MIQGKPDPTIRRSQAGAALRRWNAGYHVETIATELGVTNEEVIAVLVAGGVRRDGIAVRMRNRAGMAGHKRNAG